MAPTSTEPSTDPRPAPAPALRRPTAADGAAMWSLAAGNVDENSPYAYVMMGQYFADSCVVAELDDELVGFVTGFAPPAEPSTRFVWQIVVGPAARGLGLASMLLDELVARPASPPIRHLEATVTPDNEASRSLFRSFARRHGAPCDETPFFGADLFPAATAHDPEIRFRIGPF